MNQEDFETRYAVGIGLENDENISQKTQEKISKLEERINTLHLKIEVLIEEIAFLKSIVLSVKEMNILNKDEIGSVKAKMATKTDAELLRRYAKTIARIEAKLRLKEME
ncbi:MAG: hypothetical protein ACFE7E_05640 [Candidatus Hodarchaeota archaeon]